MKKILIIMLLSLSLFSCDNLFLETEEDNYQKDIRTLGVLHFEYLGYDDFRNGDEIGVHYLITNSSDQNVRLVEVRVEIINTHDRVLGSNIYYLSSFYMLPGQFFYEWFEAGGIKDFYKSHRIVYYKVAFEDGTFKEYY